MRDDSPMSYDQLLYYYQQELEFLQRMSATYAVEHPKIAGHLGPLPGGMHDPHVTRLMTASSLSNAQIRYKLEEEFSQTSNTLLQTLYPDVLAPIPSMAIVQFQCEDEALVGKSIIPVNTLLSSQKIAGHSCTFKTRYPVQLLPIAVKEAVLMGDMSGAPLAPSQQQCTSVLKLVLTSTHKKIALDEIDIDELRFFIHAQPAYSHALYHLIFQHTVAIAIANSSDDKTPVILEKNQLKPVGFSEAECMLPYNKRNFFGHHLLSDFFSFPEKFLFFDLVALKKPLQKKMLAANSAIEIYFYLSQSNSVLEKNINANYFSLNCTPIVNLFEKKSEPIIWDHTKTEYAITVDAKQSPAFSEIYAVSHVYSISDGGKIGEFYPFYGLKQHSNYRYYHMVRKPIGKVKEQLLPGTAVFLSFTDLNSVCAPADSATLDSCTIYADLWCTDRDLPSQLPFGGDNFIKIESAQAGYINVATLLTPITRCRRPLLNQTGYWRYVAHLSLNHLSLIEEEGIEALKNLLKLYHFDESDGHNNRLEGLLAINSKDGYAKNSHAAHAGNLLWSGKKIVLTVDEAKFGDMNLYLFGSLLSQFFSLYSSINFFTQLTIRNRQGEIFSFEPKVGDTC